MVLLKVTPRIVSAIEALPPATREKLLVSETPEFQEPISHDLIISIARSLNGRYSESENTHDSHGPPSACSSGGNNEYTLNNLLRGTQPYYPPPPPKPAPSPEYLALKAKVQAEAEQHRYNALLHPLSPSELQRQASPIFASYSDRTYDSKRQATFVDNDETDPITPSLVLNILVSVLFTGFAVYWGLSNFRIPKLSTLLPWSTPPSSVADDLHAYYYYPHAPSSQPFRVFVALFTGILVGVAEVVVYASYLRKVENAKKKEKAKVEKKTFAGLVGDHPETKAQGLAKEGLSFNNSDREEIWGRGINGGARRRVRAKWAERENSSNSPSE